MITRLFIVALLLPLAAGDGDKDGRRGNKLYGQKQYNEAAEAYQAGLSALGEAGKPWLRYALLNNLGSSLLKEGDAAAAREAFGRALLAAPNPGDVARTSYNAGNAAFEAKDLQGALKQYRESLLRDPNNEDAKFNYEFVKRRLQQQQQQQQQQKGSEKNKDDEQQQKQDSSGGQNDDEQQQQQEKPEQGESGDEKKQEADQPKENPQEGDQPQDTPTRLSQEQAERILQALQNEEEQLLRQVQRPKARPRRVEKDW